MAAARTDMRLVETCRIPAGDGRFFGGKACLRETADSPRLVRKRAAVRERHLRAGAMKASRLIASDAPHAGAKALGVTGVQVQA